MVGFDIFLRSNTKISKSQISLDPNSKISSFCNMIRPKLDDLEPEQELLGWIYGMGRQNRPDPNPKISWKSNPKISYEF